MNLDVFLVRAVTMHLPSPSVTDLIGFELTYCLWSKFRSEHWVYSPLFCVIYSSHLDDAMSKTLPYLSFMFFLYSLPQI